MTFLILIALLAVVLAARSVLLATHDGRGPQRPPASHFRDPDFLSPGGSR